MFGACEDSSVGKVFSGQAQGPTLCSLPLLTHELVMEGSKETGGVLGLANHSRLNDELWVYGEKLPQKIRGRVTSETGLRLPHVHTHRWPHRDITHIHMRSCFSKHCIGWCKNDLSDLSNSYIHRSSQGMLPPFNIR